MGRRINKNKFRVDLIFEMRFNLNQMFANQKKHTKFSLNDTLNQYGYVTSVSEGIAKARGILSVKLGQLVKIYSSNMIALNLGPFLKLNLSNTILVFFFMIDFSLIYFYLFIFFF